MKEVKLTHKSATQALDEITERLKMAEKKKDKVKAHHEISFTEKEQYENALSRLGFFKK